MTDNQPKKLKIRIISIISTIVGLIIISLLILGGSLLASKRWNPKWNPFSPNTQNSNSTVEQS